MTLFGKFKHPWAHLFLCAGLILASCDIAFVVKIGSANLRIAQIFQLIFVIIGLSVPVISRVDFVWPIGFHWLLCWAMFIVLWTPNTYDLSFSVSYTLWLLFSCAQIFAACQIYRTENEAYYLMKAYVLSFPIVAGFGMLQFSLGIVGIDLFVTQWWFPGLPRINGLSYEPSYFATYLITGWGMLAYFVETGYSVFKRNTTLVLFLLVSVALILSSSRMGNILVFGYLLLYIARNIYRIVMKGLVNKTFLAFSVTSAVALFTLLPLVAIFNPDRFKFLLQGTGLAGTANHSEAMRTASFMETVNLFLSSPVVGYSLGGIQSFIGRAHSLTPQDATGMNITAEVLAASGLLGFPFFVAYLFTLVRASSNIKGRSPFSYHATRACALGFVLLYVILQFNQNILRLYFWNHIAIISIMCVVAMGSYRRREFYRGPALQQS